MHVLTVIYYVEYRPWNIDTEDFNGGGEGFEFNDSDSILHVEGFFNVYPMSGHNIDLPTTDYTTWIHKTNDLQSRNWIDMGTRAVLISVNFVNPNLSALTTSVTLIEIDTSGNIVPSFNIRTFSYLIYNSQSATLQIVLLIFIVFQSILMFRDLLKTSEEIEYFAVRNIPSKRSQFRDPKVMIINWQEHDTKPFNKKFRKPYLGEIWSN